MVNVSSYRAAGAEARATLLDSAERDPLQSWSFTVSDDRLQPDASIPFRTSIAQPNPEATSVVVGSRTAASEAAMARILLAEDDVSVSAFVERALEHKGHEVTRCRTGSAALAALAGEAFDLLLSDIVMPSLDGIALALKASKDHPRMRILLMSGYASERQRAHNLEALAQRVLAKPFTLDEICAAVAETLAAD